MYSPVPVDLPLGIVSEPSFQIFWGPPCALRLESVRAGWLCVLRVKISNPYAPYPLIAGRNRQTINLGVAVWRVRADVAPEQEEGNEGIVIPASRGRRHLAENRSGAVVE